MTYEALVLFWVVVLGIAILVYGLLDGFDLGVGMLFGVADDSERPGMIAAIAPSWDGNETWLILIGTILFGAFSDVYAVLLPAFYIPLLLMLVGLIFRGVAFEFRAHAGPGMRGLWDAGFLVGSGVVAFVQGAALGTMIAGIPVADGQFSGDSWVWLKPLPVICGIGLMFGYAVLGAAFLVLRGPEAILWRASTWGLVATAGMAVLLPVCAIYALVLRPEAWVQLGARPWVLVPAIGWALALAGLVTAFRREERSRRPFFMAALTFACAFAVLALAFWPWMVPGALTVSQAASPEASLRFLFWGAGLIALPVVVIYTIVIYRVFRTGPVEGYTAEG